MDDLERARSLLDTVRQKGAARRAVHDAVCKMAELHELPEVIAELEQALAYLRPLVSPEAEGGSVGSPSPLQG